VHYGSGTNDNTNEGQLVLTSENDEIFVVVISICNNPFGKSHDAKQYTSSVYTTTTTKVLRQLGRGYIFFL